MTDPTEQRPLLDGSAQEEMERFDAMRGTSGPERSNQRLAEELFDILDERGGVHGWSRRTDWQFEKMCILFRPGSEMYYDQWSAAYETPNGTTTLVVQGPHPMDVLQEEVSLMAPLSDHTDQPGPAVKVTFDKGEHVRCAKKKTHKRGLRAKLLRRDEFEVTLSQRDSLEERCEQFLDEVDRKLRAHIGPSDSDG